MRSTCAQCGASLNERSIGTLGHGGTNWFECPNDCKNIWGQPEKELD